MSLKKRLTAKAVDSARDYVRERLEKLNQLGLDKDGQAYVDQIKELLVECAEKTKEALASTDFSKLASGSEQVISGVSLLGSSIDRERLSAAFKALVPLLKTTGQLIELGTRERADLRARG